jgi:hypothetical protein
MNFILFLIKIYLDVYLIFRLNAKRFLYFIKITIFAAVREEEEISSAKI